MKKQTNIEPPLIISTKKEGADIIRMALKAIECHIKMAITSPMVGMMFLKFEGVSQEEWLKLFKFILSHHWEHYLNQHTKLHIIAIHNTFDDTFDIFFTDDKKRCEEMAQMRFPESDLGF